VFARFLLLLNLTGDHRSPLRVVRRRLSRAGRRPLGEVRVNSEQWGGAGASHGLKIITNCVGRGLAPAADKHQIIVRTGLAPAVDSALMGEWKMNNEEWKIAGASHGFHQIKMFADPSLPCVKGGVERSETEGLFCRTESIITILWQMQRAYARMTKDNL